MQGGRIRNFGVGLIAIAAFAAAGILLRRRPRPLAQPGVRRVDALYAAGL